MTSLLRLGVAYHHAGIPPQLRARLEDLVRIGALHTLAATTTLAEGIDLPFKAVVIPSLFFQRTPIPKDLYLNIVGRAGRAGFGMEGCVVTVESEASSRYLRNELWNDRVQVAVAGQLGTVSRNPRTVEEFQQVWEIDSQLLGSLGDREASSLEEEAADLAGTSFTGRTRTPIVRQSVTRLFEDRLEKLMSLGLAEAASPLALTNSGRAVRLTGLSGHSGVRLRRYLDTPGVENRLMNLSAENRLTEEDARFVGRAVCESGEVLSSLLAIRFSPDPSRLLRAWDEDSVDPLEFERLIAPDVDILTGWLLGGNLERLQELAPRRQRGRFSGETEERILDLVEHMSRLTSGAAWTWSSLATLMAAQAESVAEGILRATWISGAIEYGVSSRPAVVLCEEFALSRDRANRLGILLLESSAEVNTLEDIRDALGASPEIGLAAGLEPSEVDALLD